MTAIIAGALAAIFGGSNLQVTDATRSSSRTHRPLSRTRAH
jgi:hypothetical protein